MKKILFVLSILILLAVSAFGGAQTSTSAITQQSTYDGYSLPWISGLYADLVQDGRGGSHINQLDFNLKDQGSGNYITAAKAGTVLFAKYSSSRSSCNSSEWYYANMVVIQHGASEYSWYLHLASSQVYVHKGDNVSAGQIIGVQGNTGWMNTSSCNPPSPTPTPIAPTTGHHLHFMVSTQYDANLVTNWNNPPSTDAMWPSSGTIVPIDFVEISWSDLVYPKNGLMSADKAIFYMNQNFVDPRREFEWPGEEFNLVSNSYDNVTKSIRIWPGWSVKVSDNIWGSPSACLNGGDYANLAGLKYPNTNISLDSTISLVRVYSSLNCDGTPPPACLPSSSMFATSGDSCGGPTPTPIPTSTPLPPVGGSWNVKVFTAVDECKDSPNCSPSTQVLNTTLYGNNINQNFGDGRAFGTGYTTWGAIFTQRINLAPGTYFFHLNHDDGAKVWLNGQNVMDLWGNNDSQTTCPGRYLSGPVDISVVWKNTGGGANLNFNFDTDGTACQSQSSQWNVKWYSDPNICSTRDCNPSQVYCEQNIQGGWFHIFYPSDGRACNTGNDHWGSIWKGTFNFSDGNYVFHADHDDGIKIFVGNANNGNAIMDVGGSENDNRACPAIHLSGDIPITVIHKNEGGHARINVWWDTNTTVCDPPPAANVWISKDTSDHTHVIVENGNASTTSLYLARNGQDMEITQSRWFAVSNGIEAIIPDDVDAFLVNQGHVPTVGSSIVDEWYNFASEPHWVVRKKLYIGTNDLGQTTVTYIGDHSLPTLRYFDSNGVEQTTASLWSENTDGSGITAIVPNNTIAFKLDRWIRPRLDEYTNTWWQEESYWLNKRQIILNFTSNNQIKVNYYRGSPLPVSLGRYGQDVETRSDLWQTEIVDGHINYFFIIPDGVIAFQIQGGPIPLIDTWATWSWSNYETSHWVSQNTTWVYKNASNDTQVLYANKNVNPEEVNVVYYLTGEGVERSTTSWWTKTASGLSMTIPREVESFIITRGPAPIIADPSRAEWKTPDGLWLVRKSIHIWIDSWGKTYVTYWREQTLRPKIHYVLNGQEIITTTLWTPVGDGIQARIPDGVTHFLVEINNQPYLDNSATTVWKFSALPGLWLELIHMPTPTPPVPTQTPTSTPRPSTTIKVKMKGSTADTKMRLSIGTAYTKTIVVSNVTKTFSFVVPFVVTNSHRIRVSLINGSSNVLHPTRKLQIVSINFNGITRYAKTPTRKNVFSVGAKKGLSACYSLSVPIQLIGTQATDWLYCNGYFEFR